MKIAFIIYRDAYYKHFGPIITEALKRNHDIFCLHDYSQSKDGLKGYQFPSIEKMPNFKGNVKAISFLNRDDLLKKIKENNIETVILLEFLEEHIALKKQLNISFVSLQCVYDTMTHYQFIKEADRYFFYSENWFSIIQKYLEEKKQILDRKNIRFTGSPELDQVFKIDKQEMKKKFNIPQDQKVVLLLPFPFKASSDRFWAPIIYGKSNFILQLFISIFSFKLRFIKQVIKRQNDKKVIEKIREFCDKNDAYLLVKARKKEPVRKYLKKLADQIIYDESYYPATILECMKMSDICLSFYSSAVIEASACAVPNLCITPSGKDYKNLKTDMWKVILEYQKEIFNFHGVSYKMSIPEIIKDMPLKSFSDFPVINEKRREYLEKFLPFLGKSSEKILDEIENMARIV